MRGRVFSYETVKRGRDQLKLGTTNYRCIERINDLEGYSFSNMLNVHLISLFVAGQGMQVKWEHRKVRVKEVVS